MQNERKVQSARFPIKYFQARWTRALFAGVLLFSLFPAQSFAWGRVGHRLTAKVAEEYLTPEAKAKIKDLLDGQTIADVASWADDYRSEHPETGPWHYVDIPQDAAGFDRQRDCPASTATPPSPWRDCITDRILYFEGRLGDTALSHGERAMALKFLVHLIGDVHQPFHARLQGSSPNTIARRKEGGDFALPMLRAARSDSAALRCSLRRLDRSRDKNRRRTARTGKALHPGPGPHSVA